MVVTAMPSVVDDLHAEPYLSWATSVYLVSTILGGAMMALLKARLGARLALVLAGTVVTAGGVLAAAAPGIALVLLGRVLQGLGEGVLVALSYALVRELFDIRLLPRVFGIQALTWGVALVLLGFGLIALMLRLDRASGRHIFPTVFPGLTHPVSLGLWVLLLMPLAHMSISVYTPFLLQFHRGLSPTMAGYLGAVHAVAWSVTAVVVAPFASTGQGRSIQAGPLLLALGLAGLAWALPAQPLIWVMMSLVLVGSGFGISYAFLNQRVMAAAQKGQEDATAGSAPTLGSLGGAVGAAVAGLVGQSVGLEQPLQPDKVVQAAWMLAGGGALLALLTAVLARRLLLASR